MYLEVSRNIDKLIKLYNILNTRRVSFSFFLSISTIACAPHTDSIQWDIGKDPIRVGYNSIPWQACVI